MASRVELVSPDFTFEIEAEQELSLSDARIINLNNALLNFHEATPIDTWTVSPTVEGFITTLESVDGRTWIEEMQDPFKANYLVKFNTDSFWLREEQVTYRDVRDKSDILIGAASTQGVGVLSMKFESL